MKFFSHIAMLFCTIALVACPTLDSTKPFKVGASYGGIDVTYTDSGVEAADKGP